MRAGNEAEAFIKKGKNEIRHYSNIVVLYGRLSRPTSFNSIWGWDNRDFRALAVVLQHTVDEACHNILRVLQDAHTSTGAVLGADAGTTWNIFCLVEAILVGCRLSGGYPDEQDGGQHNANGNHLGLCTGSHFYAMLFL
jgi:hypothetical protein